MSVYAETKIVPWGSVRERYDSNVWRRPKDLLRDAQGNAPQLHDFVTTVNGGLDLRHESRDIEADLKVGGNYNKYVKIRTWTFLARLSKALLAWIDGLISMSEERV